VLRVRGQRAAFRGLVGARGARFGQVVLRSGQSCAHRLHLFLRRGRALVPLFPRPFQSRFRFGQGALGLGQGCGALCALQRHQLVLRPPVGYLRLGLLAGQFRLAQVGFQLGVAGCQGGQGGCGAGGGGAQLGQLCRELLALQRGRAEHRAGCALGLLRRVQLDLHLLHRQLRVPRAALGPVGLVLRVSRRGPLFHAGAVAHQRVPRGLGCGCAESAFQRGMVRGHAGHFARGGIGSLRRQGKLRLQHGVPGREGRVRLTQGHQLGFLRVGPRGKLRAPLHGRVQLWPEGLQLEHLLRGAAAQLGDLSLQERLRLALGCVSSP